MKFTLALGNPPYGVGGNLAIRFVNKTSDITDDIWIDMFYSNTFNLEHYAAYIYISNLYDTHCIINNNISTKKNH